MNVRTPHGNQVRCFAHTAVWLALPAFALASWLVLKSGCRRSKTVRCPQPFCPVGARARPAAAPRPPVPRKTAPIPGQPFVRSRQAVLRTAWRKPRTVALRPGGKLMAVGGSYGSLELVRLADGKVVKKLGAVEELVEGLMVKFSPSGDLLASAGHDLNLVRIWDPDTGAMKRELTTTMKRVSGMAVAGNVMLVVGGSDGKVELFGLRSGRRLARLRTRYGEDVTMLDADRSGTWAVAGDVSGMVEIFNLRTRLPIGRVSTGRRLSSLAISPNGRKLALGLSSGVVRFHNIPFGDRDKRLTFRLNRRVQVIRFLPRGKSVATATDDGTVRLFRLKDRRITARLRGRGRPLTDLASDPSGKLLAAVELQTGVRIWWRKDTEEVPFRKKPKPRRTRRKPRIDKFQKVKPPAVTAVPRVPFVISNVTVERRGRLIAASGSPEQLAVWASATGQLLWHADGPPRRSVGRRSTRRPTRRRSITGRSGKAKRKTGAKGQSTARRTQPRARTKSGPVMLAFRPKRPELFSFGPSNRVYRWNALSGKPMRYRLRSRGTLKAMLFNHDGKSFFTLLKGGQVRRFRTSGRHWGLFRTLKKAYWIAVSRRGHYFVAVKGWDEINVHRLPWGRRMWNKPSGRLRRYVVKALEFDKSGGRLYTYHETGFVRVYNTRTGKLLSRHLVEIPAESSWCAFHPNMKWIACGLGRRVFVRDIKTGELVLTLKVPVGPAGGVRSLAFSLKGNALLAQVGDRGLSVWRFDTAAEPEPEELGWPTGTPVPRPWHKPKFGKPRRAPKMPKVRFPKPRRKHRKPQS